MLRFWFPRNLKKEVTVSAAPTMTMTPEQFAEFQALFAAAGAPPDRGFAGRGVDTLCAGADTLAKEGGRLVAAGNQVVSFLESAAFLHPLTGPKLRFQKDKTEALRAGMKARHMLEEAQFTHSAMMEEKSIIAGAFDTIRGVDVFRTTDTGSTLKKAIAYGLVVTGIIIAVGLVTYFLRSRGGVVELTPIEGSGGPIAAGY